MKSRHKSITSDISARKCMFSYSDRRFDLMEMNNKTENFLQNNSMAKQGMKRYKPGDGMDSEKKYGKNEVPPVPEIQGKAKQSNKKIKN